MNKYIKKSILTALALTMLLPYGLVSNNSKAEINVTRIAGSNRFETSIKVSQNFFKSRNSSAVIASGNDFRSALYASYMASSLRIPFLVNSPSTLRPDVAKELRRLGVSRVFLVGNTSTLSNKVENDLRGMKINVERLAENNQKDINSLVDQKIYNTFFPGTPRGDIDSGIVINDKIFPDLLSSVPFVAETARTQGSYLGAYYRLPATDGYKFIIGGRGTVPDSYKTFYGDINGINAHNDDENSGEEANYYTGRLAGGDRYETAIEIAKAYKPVLRKNINTVILVNGKDYPDALSSGIAGVYSNAAVLLTPPNALHESTKRFIMENGISKVIIIGGTSSVSKNAENTLRNLR